jgi:enediyne biosynthesis protein E4
MRGERKRVGFCWILVVLAAGILAVIPACRRANGPSTDSLDNKGDQEHSLLALLGDLPQETQQALIRQSSGEVLLDLYRDVTAQSGVDFTYCNGEEANHYAILESLGGGIALLDYDGDGLLDIFMTGGGYFAGTDKKQIKGYGNRLYKNLGNWNFKDVTKEVGLDQPVFYTHGCAVADYDRDGWPDLLVTGWGRVALYHNEPDGKGGRRFAEVSAAAGLTDPLWSTSAAWADLDGDGYPDLYICHYVNWSFDNHPWCPPYSAQFPREVCQPQSFTGLAHRVYRNNGNGTFTDISRRARLRPFTGDPGKDRECGKGLGVVIADVDGDGKPDIYVANDTVDNFLYINRSTPSPSVPLRGRRGEGEGVQCFFEEVALRRGVARDQHGEPNGSMGVDVADYDGSGLASIWVTNFENELHALYRNQGEGLFVFSTPSAGIARNGQFYVGFGTGFLDVDNHGWEDLVISNGHVLRHPPRTPVKQRPVLLRNLGNRRFADITPQGGKYFRGAHRGRGLAIGDLDNDGRPDLIISHVNEPVTLLRNEADVGNHWLGIELAGKEHRDVAGAKVVVEVDGRRLTRFAKGGGSYLSSADRRLLFGLGKAAQISRLTVIWPWGPQQYWRGEQLPIDRYWRLIEGKNSPEISNR